MADAQELYESITELLNNGKEYEAQNILKNADSQQLYECAVKLINSGQALQTNTAIYALKLAYACGNMNACILIGNCYSNKKNEEGYKEAVKWYTIAAENGVANAQMTLGLCYSMGRGVEKDYVKSSELIEKAANQGLHIAQSVLGMRYELGTGVVQNYRTAAIWYAKAADQGSANGLYYLARCYEEGNGTIQDISKAVKLYQAAADKEQVDAMNKMGVLYYFGNLVEHNISKAVELFSKAAERENKESQYYLAKCFEDGYGVEADNEKAVYWYEKSALQNYLPAQSALGILYLSIDPAKAYEYLNKASEKNDIRAQIALASAYSGGAFGEIDRDKAAYWFGKLAAQDNSIGQYGLGTCYANPKWNNYDPVKAVEWYSKAAEQSLPFAQYEMGMAHLHGFGNTKKHDGWAGVWFKRAALQGHAPSQFQWSALKFQRGTDDEKKEAIMWLQKSAEQNYPDSLTSLGLLYFYGDGLLEQNKALAKDLLTRAAEMGNSYATAFLETSFGDEN